MRRNNIFGAKSAQLPVNNIPNLLQSLNWIPENTIKANKIEASEASVSDFPESESISSKEKVEDNQALIKRLLKRDHNVFKKNHSSKRIPYQTLFDFGTKIFYISN